MANLNKIQKESWEIIVVTPGRKYKGNLYSVGYQDKRTTSILNSPLKLMHYTRDVNFRVDVFMELLNATIFGHHVIYPNIFIRKSEIIFVYDEFHDMGSINERMRFENLGGHAEKSNVEILTKCFSGQYFKITGNIFHLQQKFLSQELFIPVTEVKLINISGLNKIKSLQETLMPFIALNKDFIEAISILPI
jgi:hypothetical protein